MSSLGHLFAGSSLYSSHVSFARPLKSSKNVDLITACTPPRHSTSLTFKTGPKLRHSELHKAVASNLLSKDVVRKVLKHRPGVMATASVAGEVPGEVSEGVAEKVRGALAEVQHVFDQMEATEGDPLGGLVAAIHAARNNRIVVYGVGREGLMMRALSMRLFHLGLPASVVGDMSCPPVGPGDLLLVSAGPGHFATVEALMRVAKQAGASVALLSAQQGAQLGELADLLVVLPGRTMADGVVEDGGSMLVMGSLYEAALYFCFEYLVFRLQSLLQQSNLEVDSRHTNLE